jgi:hypothetical protein
MQVRPNRYSIILCSLSVPGLSNGSLSLKERIRKKEGGCGIEALALGGYRIGRGTDLLNSDKASSPLDKIAEERFGEARFLVPGIENKVEN